MQPAEAAEDDDFFFEGKFKYIIDDDETIAPLKKGRKSIVSSATFEEYDIFEVDKDLFIQDSDKFPYIKDDTPHIWAYANKWAADKESLYFTFFCRSYFSSFYYS